MKYFAACLLLVATPVLGDAATRLNLGAAVWGVLAVDEGDTFEINLDAGRFVYLEVEQRSVDVRVVVRDPAGAALVTTDSAPRGAEPVQFETTDAGLYRLEVLANEDEAGDYAIELQKSDPIALDPDLRLEQLLTRFAGDDTPGAVVAIVRDGSVAHAHAVGMANLAYAIPFERDTVSNIGSVSKQFTAMAVVMLAESGKLSLDDNVRKYFPTLPDLGAIVTVRQLLNHSNGYREFLNLLAMTGLRLELGDFIDRDAVLDILRRQPELQDPPGTRFNYNNSAYTLAALLVEQVTETPFDDWVDRNIFDPLGMDETRIRSFTGEIMPGAADGYLPADEAPWRHAIDLGGGGGATMGPGGIYSTVDDLARWMGNFQSANIGGDAVLKQLMTPSIAGPGGDEYGLGLFIGEHRGLPYVEHGGADTAHRAQLLYFPSIDSGVIALSNNGTFNAYATAMAAAEAFFADQFEPEASAEAAADAGDADNSEVDNSEVDSPEVDSPEVDLSAFDGLRGQFELEDFPGIVLEIARAGGKLVLLQGDNPPLELTPMAANQLRLSPDQIIEFDASAGGGVDSFLLRGDNDFAARRLDSWVPEPDELTEFTGRYFSTELQTIYSIEKRDSELVLTHPRLDDMVLKPKTKDSFSTTGVLNEVAFERDERGVVAGMLVSNVRTRNVRFRRQSPES